MANQAVRLWHVVLDSLKDMATDNSKSRAGVTELLKNIASSPQQPKASWKRLVKDMQLPRKLGLFASSKLVLDPCDTGLLLPAVLEAVRTLLSTAQRDCMPHVQAEILQQMASSGLFKALDQLKEATAQQLEQGAAAAAAAAGGDLASEALLQAAAGLMCVQEHMDVLLDSGDESLAGSMLGSSSSTAGAHHLMCASFKHITMVRPLYLQQDQQAPAPPKILVHLAHNLAGFARRLAAGVHGDSKQTLTASAAGIAQAVGQHYVAWATPCW